MKIIQDFTTILIADEGYILTNGVDYSDIVYLGKNDSPENWHEEEMTEEWEN